MWWLNYNICPDKGGIHTILVQLQNTCDKARGPWGFFPVSSIQSHTILPSFFLFCWIVFILICMLQILVHVADENIYEVRDEENPNGLMSKEP